MSRSAALARLVPLAALVLLVEAAPDVARGDEPGAKTLRAIRDLVQKAQGAGLSREERGQLHGLLNDVKERLRATWEQASAKEISESVAGHYWKSGQQALLSSLQVESTKSAGGVTGWWPTGKGFLNEEFHPLKSDYDLTVLGTRSSEAIDAFSEHAPPGYVESLKMSIMEGQDTFLRRGPTGKVSPEQMKAAREKLVTKLAPRLDVRGGYASVGATTAGVEHKALVGTYSDLVQFVGSDGKDLGHLPITQLRDLKKDFGLIRPAQGDLVGMALDNLAQIANYVEDKGSHALGILKTVERQLDVVKELPPELRAEFEQKFAGLEDEIKALKGLSPAEREARAKAGKFSVDALVLACDDVARLAGRTVDPKLLSQTSGAALRLEENLIASIANAGGLEKLRELHKGNKAFLDALEKVAGRYDGHELQGLVNLRSAALGKEREAMKAADGFLAALKAASPSLAKRLGPLLRNLPEGVLVDLSFELAAAASTASEGRAIEALNGLSEGLVSLALPEVGIPLLVKNLAVGAMNLAVGVVIDASIDEPRLARAYKDIMFRGDDGRPDFATLLHGIKTYADMEAYVRDQWQFSDKAFELARYDYGTEGEGASKEEKKDVLMKRLARMLWDARPKLVEQEGNLKYDELAKWAEEKKQKREAERQAALAAKVRAAVRAEKAKAPRPTPVESKAPPVEKTPPKPGEVSVVWERSYFDAAKKKLQREEPVIESGPLKGKYHGLVREFSMSTGKVKLEEPWFMGELHGTVRDLDDKTGKPTRETPYVKGKRHGEQRTYDSRELFLGQKTTYDEGAWVETVQLYRSGKVREHARAVSPSEKETRTFSEDGKLEVHRVEKSGRGELRIEVKAYYPSGKLKRWIVQGRGGTEKDESYPDK